MTLFHSCCRAPGEGESASCSRTFAYRCTHPTADRLSQTTIFDFYSPIRQIIQSGFVRFFPRSLGTLGALDIDPVVRLHISTHIERTARSSCDMLVNGHLLICSEPFPLSARSPLAWPTLVSQASASSMLSDAVGANK